MIRAPLAAALFLSAASPVATGVPADSVTGDMSLGNPKAKVRVVEYASAACHRCAAFHQTVFPRFRRRYVDTGTVYFTVKEYITDPPDVAVAGFILARCGGPARYFDILDQVFASQSQWRPNHISSIFTKIGEANGLTEGQVHACYADQAALDALTGRVHEAMERDRVAKVPTILVNGKALQGEVTLEALSNAIDAAEKR